MFCIYVFFSQMTVSGFVGAVPSTLQASFGFSVVQTSALSTTYSLTKLFTTIPLTYFCGKTSIPGHFGWMIASMGIGSCLFALPGLLADITEGENQYVCRLPTVTNVTGALEGDARVLGLTACDALEGEAIEGSR